MATVQVTIPSMLATLAHTDRTFVVHGDDLGQVLAAVFDRHPELEIHVLDERGELRHHVMLFHNDVAVRSPEGTVGEGDHVTILQAVSGG